MAKGRLINSAGLFRCNIQYKKVHPFPISLVFFIALRLSSTLSVRNEHEIYNRGGAFFKLEIRNISWMQTLPVRHEVLWPREEQSYSKIEGDENGQHFGAYVNEQLVCVASIFTENGSARLRKFATIKEYQGNGIGTEMLKHVVNELKKLHISYFWFDARETAIGFYDRLGFEIEGERFFKNTMPYFKMSMSL